MSNSVQGELAQFMDNIIMEMQNLRNLNVMPREKNKKQNQPYFPFASTAEEKLSVMEALDHFFVSRHYQEIGTCTVCQNICIKKCSACGIFYCSNECQTIDWPQHRSHCAKQKDSSSTSSRKMRGSSVKNFIQDTFLWNERGSPFTSLTNSLNKSTNRTYSGTKSMTNFKLGNRQFQNKEPTFKISETGNNGNKDLRKSILNDRKKEISPKKFNRKSPTEEKNCNSNNKNDFKAKIQNSQAEQKITENISNGNETLDRKRLPKIEKMEVVGTFRESPNRYWVMNVNNLKKYEQIQKDLNENIQNLESTYAKVGLVCGCSFGDEWFRAKIVSLTPKTTVHFIDYGNISNYDLKNFKKLPKELESMPGLVFLIEFEEGTPPQYKTSDLDSVKMTIEETSKTTDGIAKVKILEGAYGATLKLESVKNSLKLESVKNSLKLESVKNSSDTNNIKSTRSVLNCITVRSHGMLFFIPGEGAIRFASIVPDNHKEASDCLERVLDIENSSSTPFEAEEGDYVLVTDNEGNNQRGRVTSKIGSVYFVQLIDCGNAISTEQVFPMVKDLKEWIELGVKVTIEEFILPKEVEKLETCFFLINGKEISGKWPCIIKGPEHQIIAKGFLEQPIETPKWKPKYVSLKSGSTVEISSLSTLNSFYVRSVDAEIEQRLLDMNMEIIRYAKAPSYSSPPSIGELCCARFEGDSCFYRAVVNSVKGRNVNVLFVDFGNEQMTDLKNVKPISDSLKNIPFFAVRVKLKRVTNKTMNNKIKEYITKLTSENIELTLTYIEPSTNEVVLREKVSGVIMNEFIEKAKDTDSILANSSFLRKEEIFLDDDLKFPIIDSGTKCDMALLFIDESEFKKTYTFWATIADTENFLYVNGELSSMIKNYCTSVKTPYKPSFRELCLAEFEGYWYRASCVGCDNDVFKVFFIDFGNVCQLNSSSIRKMNKNFIKAPALAMNCAIKGFERLKDKPNLIQKIWEELQERLNTLIVGVIITKTNDFLLLEIPEIETILSG